MGTKNPIPHSTTYFYHKRSIGGVIVDNVTFDFVSNFKNFQFLFINFDHITCFFKLFFNKNFHVISVGFLKFYKNWIEL